MIFVVAGHPIAHSKSPAMWNAAFAELGLPHRYEARDVDAEGLRALVAALRADELGGINVTVPHKTLACSLADVVSTTVGAANTLARLADGRIEAINTDVAGLERELRRLGARFGEGRALVLGSGGAARATVAALAALGFSRITVRARNHEAAARLGDVVRGAPVRVDITIEPLGAGADDDVGVIVQATSAGMRGADDGHAVAASVAWDVLPPHAVAYDVVYAPAVTPFVAAARKRNLVADSGLGMLVAQAAVAFERWLDMPAPIDVMRDAVRDA